jgi:hypothetical protein
MLDGIEKRKKSNRWFDNFSISMVVVVMSMAVTIISLSRCSLFNDGEEEDTVLAGVYIVESIITMYEGEEREIEVTLVPQKAAGVIEYSISHDEAIAITDQGNNKKIKIKAHGLGETVLMASVGGFVDRCTITVKEKKDTVLYFDPEKLEIGIGEYGEAAVGIEERDRWDLTKLAWVSLNPGIAEIFQASPDKVIVQGKKAGQTVIQAGHPDLGVAGLAVTVSDAGDGVTIKIEKSVYEVVLGKQVSITASLEGGNGNETDGFEWEAVQDGNYIKLQAFANTLIVTALEKGTAQVTVSHEKASKEVEITVMVLLEEEVLKYITVDNDTLNMTGNEASFTSQLEGGSVLDNLGFVYTIVDGAEVIRIEGSGNVCRVVKKKAGLAEIQVTHPKAENSVLVQVIVH